MSPYLLRKIVMSMDTVLVARRDVQLAYKAAENLMKPKCPGVLKGKLTEFKYLLRQAAIPIEEAIQAIDWDHTSKVTVEGKEVGKPLELNGRVIPNVYERDERAFTKAVSEYLAGDIELRVPLFTQDEIEKLGEIEGDTEGLYPFIKDKARLVSAATT